MAFLSALLLLVLLVTNFASFALLATLTVSVMLATLSKNLGKRFKRILFAVSSIALIMLTIPSAIHARTITVTSTITDYFTTTRTYWQDTTITPTVTITVGTKSTVTVFVPTTTYLTKEEGALDVSIDNTDPRYLGEPWKMVVTVRNPTGRDISATLVVDKIVFPDDPQKIVGRDAKRWLDFLFGSHKWRLDVRINGEPAQEWRRNILVKAGQKLDPQVFQIKSVKWNWLDPNITTEIIASMVLLYISTFYFTFASLDAFLKWIKALYQGADFTKNALSFLREQNEAYTFIPVLERARAYDSSGQLLGSCEKTIPVYVDESKMHMAQEAINGALLATIFSIFAAMIVLIISLVFTGGSLATAAAPIFKLVMAGLTAGALGASLGAYVCAQDPDPKYTQVVSTPKPNIPSSILELPEGVGKEMALAGYRYSAFLTSAAEAMTRYYAAKEDHQTRYMILQLSSSNQHLNSARDELKRMLSLYPEFSKYLPEINPSVVASAKSYIREKGFPEEFKNVFMKVGKPEYASVMQTIIPNVPDNVWHMPVQTLLNASSSSVASLVDINNEQIKTIQKSETQEMSGQLLPVVVSFGVASGVTCIFLVAVFARRSRRSTRSRTVLGRHIALSRHVRLCPTCHRIASYNSREGGWYCPHCRRSIA